MNDRSGPSLKNLLGLFPMGQRYDDPLEPGMFGYYRGVYRQGITDPYGAISTTVRDYFAF